MSVRADLDPLAHLELGRALAPLRSDDVLTVGSGASFHNFAAFGSPEGGRWDDWLNATMIRPAAERWEALAHWTEAPAAGTAHAQEEHLIPLMVAAGAAGDHPARTLYRGRLLETASSSWLFD